jgi:hypothetical protein
LVVVVVVYQPPLENRPVSLPIWEMTPMARPTLSLVACWTVCHSPLDLPAGTEKVTQ